MERARNLTGTDRTANYADMFGALGSEPRLQIVRLLLSAHPDGMVIGEIQSELGIAAAITDAVHHAAGIRVRELPVKIEDLIA